MGTAAVDARVVVGLRRRRFRPALSADAAGVVPADGVRPGGRARRDVPHGDSLVRQRRPGTGADERDALCAQHRRSGGRRDAGGLHPDPDGWRLRYHLRRCRREPGRRAGRLHGDPRGRHARNRAARGRDPGRAGGGAPRGAACRARSRTVAHRRANRFTTPFRPGGRRAVAGRRRPGALGFCVADARNRLDPHPRAGPGPHHLCLRGDARGRDRRRRHRLGGGIVDGEPRAPACGVAGHRAGPGGDHDQLYLFAGRTADSVDRGGADGECGPTLRPVAALRIVADRRPDPADGHLPGRGLPARTGVDRGRRQGRHRTLWCGLCHQHHRRRVWLTRRRLPVHSTVRSPGHAAGGERLPDRRGRDRGAARRTDRRGSCGGPGGRVRRRGAAGDQSCLGPRAAGQRTVHVCALRPEGSRPRHPAQGGDDALLPGRRFGHGLGEEADRHHHARRRRQGGRLESGGHAHAEAGGAPAAAGAREPAPRGDHRPRQRRQRRRRAAPSDCACRRPRDFPGGRGGLALLHHRESRRACQTRGPT